MLAGSDMPVLCGVHTWLTPLPPPPRERASGRISKQALFDLVGTHMDHEVRRFRFVFFVCLRCYSRIFYNTL